MLAQLWFALSPPLSVLAVEMLPQDNVPTEPLSANLGGQRVLRTLKPVPVLTIC
jgi:hypothetical protein